VIASTPELHVDIWSDVVCPWCYIGKRRFEAAVAEIGTEMAVTVRYRAYQLDPGAPAGTATPVAEAYAKKFGGAERAAAIIDHVTTVAAGEGIEFRLDRAVRANTFDAHRLLWLASATGNQAAVKEHLLRAYFTDGQNIADRQVLADCAASAGLPHDQVLRYLDSEDGVEQVRAELAAARDAEITAVPTFVVNDAWAVPGAQDAGTFTQVLRSMATRLRQAQ
jgi:predicted DsbA family dithiol-disulfide isomerase